MRKALPFVLLLAGSIFLQFCSTSKKVASGDQASVSYARDVAPIMLDRCTPCHFPNGGKKKFLDTYAAMKENIDDVIARVEKDPGEDGFMPFKSKKEPLSDSLIQVLVTWRDAGMPQ